MTVQVFDSPPAGLWRCDATQLHALLGGPALVHVRGEKEPPLFVSVLLHGNEVSGWNALCRLLGGGRRPPRSLLVFIGNVEAAAHGLRMLPNQRDFNRIWRGDDGSAECFMARGVIDYVRRVALFAAVDLHNNTGHNPHYAVLTRLDSDFVGLAYMFSSKAVLVEEPDTVLARAFDSQCVVVTLELGPVNDPMCEERALDFLRRCLSLALLPAGGAIDLYQTRARVHVREGVEFSFADENRDTPLVLTSGVEAVNFHHLLAGTRFGRCKRPLDQLLCVLDAAHHNVTDRFLLERDGEIELVRAVVPAMYTTDPLVVRQDCLCYFMEPVSVPTRSVGTKDVDAD